MYLVLENLIPNLMGQLLNVEMALGLLAKVQGEHVLDMEGLAVGYEIFIYGISQLRNSHKRFDVKYSIFMIKTVIIIFIIL